MAVELTEEECVEVVKYVSWLEETLGGYEYSPEYKKYEKTFDKIIKGQFAGGFKR